MIRKIQMNFPREKEQWNKGFSEYLAKLTEQSEGKSLFPKLEIQFNNLQNPSVDFQTDNNLKILLQTKGLSFGFNIGTNKIKFNSSLTNLRLLKDIVGGYYNVEIDKEEFSLLTMKQLFDRVSKFPFHIDHAGINFSPKQILPKEYLNFKRLIGKNSYLVDYPQDGEWPFIIPVSKDEQNNGIKNFEIDRNPKFEFVYDEYNAIPSIQFDVYVDATKEEIFKLLPDPYGFSFKILKDNLRSVYILTEFTGALVRFDISFKKGGKTSFTKWLIEEGKRVK